MLGGGRLIGKKTKSPRGSTVYFLYTKYSIRGTYNWTYEKVGKPIFPINTTK